MLCDDLFSLESGQSSESHIDYCLGLNIGKTETCHQGILGFLHVRAVPYNVDYLINIVEGNQ